jgi:hypothetical protein
MSLLFHTLQNACHGYKWSLLNVRKGNTKGSFMEPRWNLEAKRVYFCSSGALKTYDNLWEGRNQVIFIQ